MFATVSELIGQIINPKSSAPVPAPAGPLQALAAVEPLEILIARVISAPGLRLPRAERIAAPAAPSPLVATPV